MRASPARRARARTQVRRVIHFVAQHNHDLLDGRHMDQIVLAGLYGICRIHQADVTFKDLVEAYKRMPSASKELWLNVPLLEPGRTGNIIAFYNEVRAAPARAPLAPAPGAARARVDSRDSVRGARP